MNRVAANSNANNASHRSANNEEEPTGRRRTNSRAAASAQKDNNSRKASPETARTRGQTKRKKKKGSRNDEKTDKHMEEDTEDSLVVEEHDEHDEDDHTDSDDSSTDSDTNSDSDVEDATNTNQNNTEDAEEEDEDEVMDDDFYARRRRSLIGQNANFNYTRLALEKLTDHPIVLRGCDHETLWNKKELAHLQEDLRILYKKARQRIKTMKRDVRKLDTELQRKRDLVAKRPKTALGEEPSSIAPLSYTDHNGVDFQLLKNNAKQRICGVMNSRGNPCQRTGFCPFHHKLTNSRTTAPVFHGFIKPRDDPMLYEESGSELETALLASGPKERQEKMQVSILLVAAAALERTGIDETVDVAMKDQQQQQPLAQVTPMQQDSINTIQQPIIAQQSINSSRQQQTTDPTSYHSYEQQHHQQQQQQQHHHTSFMQQQQHHHHHHHHLPGDSLGSYHYSSIKPPSTSSSFPPMGQLPSLHDLQKQPPPPFPFPSSENNADSYHHGITRNNPM